MRRWLLTGLAAVAMSSTATAADTGPRLLAPGVVSTGDSESHATLSADGGTLYWVKLTPDFAHWTVVAAERRGDGWGEPGVAWFSGRFDDADVSFAPDGSAVYFISNRPDRESDPARPDTDLFRIRRAATGWGPPERLAELASAGNEWFPNQASDGTLYFGSERRDGNFGPEGTADLWRARPRGDGFAPPENLGPVINTEGQEIEPWISADGGTLVFAAKGRADSLGSYDIYVSYRCGEGAEAWTPPRPLRGGVNSPAWDFAGRFTPDGRTFFFASNRTIAPSTDAPLAGAGGYRQLLDRLRSPGNSLFDNYEVPAAELGLASPCADPPPARPDAR